MERRPRRELLGQVLARSAGGHLAFPLPPSTEESFEEWKETAGVPLESLFAEKRELRSDRATSSRDLDGEKEGEESQRM